MNSHIFFCFTVVGMLAWLSPYGQTPRHDYQELKQGFAHPPLTALPKVYWWWLNGNVNNARLKQELVDMKKAGIGGVEIFDIGIKEGQNPDNMVPAGPAFMGDESLQSIKFAIDEAGKLGLEVDLNLSSSWNAGGSWIKPESAAKTLYYSRIRFDGSKRQKIRLPFPEITPDKKGLPRQIAYTPEGKPVYYKEVVVLAMPAGQHNIDTSKIINVSGCFDPGTELLDWDAPAGEWDIYRYVCANSGEQLNSPSPNSRGPIIDHFDPAATGTHVMYFINKLKPLIGDFRHSALKALYLASYEAADFTWTPDLPAAFRKLTGYDIYKFMPSIFNKDLYPAQMVENFQFDFRKTLSALMIKNHYGRAREICNQYGLKLISESGGPGGWHSIPVETLKALGTLDIPRGEFWNKYEVHDKGDSVDVKWLVKEIAAASHIYKRGLVEEESFTSYQHWQEGPLDLKPLADRAFCEGMNRLVIHGFSHEPSGNRRPGIAFFAGTHFDDRNVWWPKIRPFNEYLGRISYILQRSDFVSDVLYYNGDGVPNLVPPKNTRFKVGPGYDYEVVNTDILVNKLTVEDGELSIPGVARYKLLYIGENTDINPLVLAKLGKLAEAGAIIIGKKPVQADGLGNRDEADKKVKSLADKYWVSAATNDLNGKLRKKGVIYSDILPLQVLKEMKVPADFSYDGQSSPVLDYIHYKTDSLDFYLVRNTTDKWIPKYCYFRQQAKSPEIWDPVTGNIAAVPIYEGEGQQIKLLLTLAPYETRFVVFKKQASSPRYTEVAGPDGKPPLIRYTKEGFYFLDKGKFEIKTRKGVKQIQSDPEVTDLGGPWKITFPKGWGAPDAVSFPALISWSKADDRGVRYFSGTATYRKIFKFKRGKSSLNGFKAYLDLGSLKEVGEVWLNDRPLGITWAMPYRMDITDLIKEGRNDLKVEIANTWLNRLIGDAKTKEKFTSTNLTKGNPNLLLHDYIIPNNVAVPWEELPLRESGLLGPVTIQVIKTVR